MINFCFVISFSFHISFGHYKDADKVYCKIMEGIVGPERGHTGSHKPQSLILSLRSVHWERVKLMYDYNFRVL